MTFNIYIADDDNEEPRDEVEESTGDTETIPFSLAAVRHPRMRKPITVEATSNNPAVTEKLRNDSKRAAEQALKEAKLALQVSRVSPE